MWYLCPQPPSFRESRRPSSPPHDVHIVIDPSAVQPPAACRRVEVLLYEPDRKLFLRKVRSTYRSVLGTFYRRHWYSVVPMASHLLHTMRSSTIPVGICIWTPALPSTNPSLHSVPRPSDFAQMQRVHFEPKREPAILAYSMTENGLGAVRSRLARWHRLLPSIYCRRNCHCSQQIFAPPSSPRL